MTDTILFNGRITTLDPANPTATAVAIKDWLLAAVGDDREIITLRGPKTRVIDLHGRTVVSGLNDSHTHLIRGGLNYNVVGGRVVHGDHEFKDVAPPLPPAMPDWSPIRVYGGYQRTTAKHANAAACSVLRHAHAPVPRLPIRPEDTRRFWGALGCGCFAF